MADKVVLNSLTSGFNIARIENNFEKIEDALNEGVLWRKLPLGATENALQENIDANGKRIINLPAPQSNTEPVRWGDVSDIVQAVEDAVDASAEATLRAQEAAASAVSAGNYAASAASSESQAANYADLAASNSRLEIGTVTTVSPSTPASAAITGTPGNQQLSLSIPQGIQGPQGDPGPIGTNDPMSLVVSYTSGRVSSTTIDGQVRTITYNSNGTVNTISWPVGALTHTETYSYSGGLITGMTATEV